MNIDFNFYTPTLNVGDIVCELHYIVPPDRKPWHGIVVDVLREHYHDDTWTGYPEDMITVKWFGSGLVEHLPAPVLLLVQEVK